MAKASYFELIKYCFIGVLNTGVHFLVFFLIQPIILAQSFSNLIAFAFAVTFSFFMNARFTFQSRPTLKRFVKMSSFMAIISFLFGLLGDIANFHPFLTLVIYFVLNPIIGFLVTKYWVFRD